MFLNQFQITVSSSELSAFEHRKLWCLQILCWLHGEQSLPIGLLVLLVDLWVFFSDLGLGGQKKAKKKKKALKMTSHFQSFFNISNTKTVKLVK